MHTKNNGLCFNAKIYSRRGGKKFIPFYDDGSLAR